MGQRNNHIEILHIKLWLIKIYGWRYHVKIYCVIYFKNQIKDLKEFMLIFDKFSILIKQKFF